jgi:glycine/D-amino acid oxidase-like deaminating enzyme
MPTSQSRFRSHSRSDALARAADVLRSSAPRRSPYAFEEAFAGVVPARPLRGFESVDVCVVGGGYAGLWTAINVKQQEPSLRVVLVEADRCGAGAAGRNSGFALSWWMKLPALVRLFGRDDGLRLAAQSAAAIDEIARLCERERIDAHLVRGGFIYGATSHAQTAALDPALHAAAEHGDSPLEALSAAEIHSRVGSDAFLAGVYERCGVTVQPALLARGLIDVALRHGVEIYEGSKVRRVERTRGLLELDGGSVKAGAIVLAMGAWLCRMRPIARAVIPLGSYACVTEPVPDVIAMLGWRGGEGITDMAMTGGAISVTHDQRIKCSYRAGALSFAGRIRDGFWYDERATAKAVANLHRLFPRIPPVRITHAWGGAVDRSLNGLPFHGALPGGVPIVYAAGFSGNGIAPSVISGKILAASVLDRGDQWSEHPLNRGVPPGRFPPEPLRSIAGRLVRRAVRRADERQRLDRPLDPLTRRIAAFAPPGYKESSQRNART